jgi:primase-polymerase (primpol)-like protein
MISDALQPLTRHHQFIVYRRESSKTRPGKTDKIPCDYRTGKTASAHDPAIWLNAPTALQIVAAWGNDFGIGFVLTAECKLFCLDIDDCLQSNREWSPKALQVCKTFPGAAIEVSLSGRGLHIWGTYTGDMPLHASKNKALGIELYTEKRFIALGRSEGTTGSALTDRTLALHSAIASYFRAAPAQAIAQEWTIGPCEEWCGPVDDTELLRRAMQSLSGAATFGLRASFADLWQANEEVLGRAYPAEGRPYDCSSADAALAQHLAFWTGKDCARIRRLMEQSKLCRDKWSREDYLPRTILRAVEQQTDIYVDEVQRRQEQIEENLLIGDGSDLLPTAGTFTLEEMLSRFVYVVDGMQVVDRLAPQRIVSLEEWKRSLKASRTALEVKGQFNIDGSQKTKNYATSELWETNTSRNQVHTVTFRPGAQLLTYDPDGRQAINLWKPFERNTAAGDASLFIEHIAYLFGDDAMRFLDWLAHIEQRPGELPHHGWVHISPEHGTGRNWLSSVIARVWKGHVAANFDLSGMLRTGFNGALSRKLIAIVDEIREGGAGARWENAETLKRIVTEEHRTINPKYGRQRMEFNACRWLIFSNHVSALPLEENDRRFNIVRNDAPPKKPAYYGRLYAVLKDSSFVAGVAQLLNARSLVSFNPGAHATLNEAKRDLVEASLSEADRTLRDVLEHWPTDVVLSSTLGQLLAGGVVGGTLTPGHRNALERRGIKPYRSNVKFMGAAVRVSILRNHARWKDADPSVVRSELEKVQYPMLNPRHYLEDHAAT